MRPWLALPVIASLAVLVGGCSTSSSTPGLGGIGGINTPGAGTSNPEATVFCRMKGTAAGDFTAQDAVARLNPLGIQMEGKGLTYVNGRYLERNVIVDFYVVPVAGRTYTVGQFGEADTAIAYSEKVRGGTKTAIWMASGGKVKVKSLSGDTIKGSFKCKLEPASDAVGTITATDGDYSVKVIE